MHPVCPLIPPTPLPDSDSHLLPLTPVSIHSSLAFSVTLFCCEAAMAIGLMLLRRHPRIGGELGGPRGFKVASSLFLFMLWVVYVVMSALEAYGKLPFIKAGGS